MVPPMKERLEEFFREEYRHTVNRVAGRVGGKTNAEDVVQEAFSRALKYRDTYKEGEEFLAWFNTILNNCARDFKKQDRLDGMSDPVEEAGADMDHLQQQLWLVEAITEEMNNREQEHSRILKGYFLKGWRPREIMEFSPLKGAHIRKIIQRFKEEMRCRYGEELRI